MKLFTFNKVKLQPVKDDDTDDELIQAILADQTVHDDTWQLNEVIDGDEAARMWRELESEESGGK